MVCFGVDPSDYKRLDRIRLGVDWKTFVNAAERPAKAKAKTACDESHLVAPETCRGRPTNDSTRPRPEIWVNILLPQVNLLFWRA